MKKIHAISLTGFLFGLITPYLHAEMVSDVEVPSVAQMKSSSTPYGLNLNAVHARYYHLETAKVSNLQNDISAIVLKIREIKKGIKKVVMKKISLQNTPGVLKTDPRILAQTQTIQILNNDLVPLLHNVMQTFNISIEQATKIPADS